MPSVKRIQFSIQIFAPVKKVFDIMLAPETYQDWTSAFMAGSYYQGTWAEGEKIRFLSPSGEGMYSEVAEYRPNEFVSIRHLGFINANGEIDTTSDAVRQWTPAYENYTFAAIPGGTKLVIDQDVTEEYEAQMTQSWNNGLKRLKELCEG